MSDRGVEAVHDLLALYGLCLDRLLVEEWLDLFTDDAVLDVDGNVLDTRAARRHLALTAPRGLHVGNLPVIDGDIGADELEVTSTFLFWNKERGTTRMGWYEDSLRRSGPAWRFTSRRISFLG